MNLLDKGGRKVLVGQCQQGVVDIAAQHHVGRVEVVVAAHEAGQTVGGQQVEVGGLGVCAQRVVEAVEGLIKFVAGHIGGLLHAEQQLLAAFGPIGIEKGLGDEGGVEHLADEREEFLGIAAQEIERHIADTYVGHLLHHDAAEVEKFGHTLSVVPRGGLGHELVGAVGLRLVGLIAAPRLEGEVELRQLQCVVLKTIEGPPVGQRMGLRDKGL